MHRPFKNFRIVKFRIVGHMYRVRKNINGQMNLMAVTRVTK